MKTSWSKSLTRQTDVRINRICEKSNYTKRQNRVHERLKNLAQIRNVDIIDKINQHSLNFTLESSEQITGNILQLRCRQCNQIQSKNIFDALSDRCDFCNPVNSRQQIEIYKYIRSLNIDADLSDKDLIYPYELDILVPKFGLAIELNQLYFDSELFKHKEFHFYKTTRCQNVNIQLIHIFEDEWRDKNLICKNIIKKCLVPNTEINIDKLNFIKLDKQSSSTFIKKYHIDGESKNILNFGIEYDDKLVFVASLRHVPHKLWKKCIEVIRYCSIDDLDEHFLLDYAMKKIYEEITKIGYEKLLLRLDTRYQPLIKNDAYKQIHQTKINFFWTDGYERIDDFKIRRDASNTTREISDQLGLIKIWACPHIIYDYNCAP